MSREQLKQVFSNVLRWQLQRIEQDQAGNLADAGAHATANSLHAEAWEFLDRGGVAARWTLAARLSRVSGAPDRVGDIGRRFFSAGLMPAGRWASKGRHRRRRSCWARCRRASSG